MGRNRTNAPIYAGSNTLISRKALEEVGYIKTGTITEDFATGIEIQEKGYRCYAIDKTLAHGLAPVGAGRVLAALAAKVEELEQPGRGIEIHGALHVEGRSLTDSQGRTVQLRGMSTHGLMWYPQYANAGAVKTVGDHGGNAMRLARAAGGGPQPAHRCSKGSVIHGKHPVRRPPGHSV